MKNIGNDPRSLFNGNHFSSHWRANEASETLSGLFNRESYIYYWASEASPTLGCSIEISRDIYM